MSAKNRQALTGDGSHGIEWVEHVRRSIGKNLIVVTPECAFGYEFVPELKAQRVLN